MISCELEIYTESPPNTESHQVSLNCGASEFSEWQRVGINVRMQRSNSGLVRSASIEAEISWGDDRPERNAMVIGSQPLPNRTTITYWHLASPALRVFEPDTAIVKLHAFNSRLFKTRAGTRVAWKDLVSFVPVVLDCALPTGPSRADNSIRPIELAARTSSPPGLFLPPPPAWVVRLRHCVSIANTLRLDSEYISAGRSYECNFYATSRKAYVVDDSPRPRHRRHHPLAIYSGAAGYPADPPTKHTTLATRPSGRLARMQTAERTSRVLSSSSTLTPKTALSVYTTSPPHPHTLPLLHQHIFQRSDTGLDHYRLARLRPRRRPITAIDSVVVQCHRVAVHRRRQTKSIHCVRQTRVGGAGAREGCRMGSP
ncbi:hypothetical protein C8F01DRAFT_1231773 [Mycena amicta]|nr:hypothetical protein C8F01DRAFT_1231773 [Mycena amicta]